MSVLPRLHFLLATVLLLSLRCRGVKGFLGWDWPTVQQCGRVPSPWMRAAVIGGGRTSPERWPWYAALVPNSQAVNYGSDGGRGLRVTCGATLVTPKHLLTAAHCFDYRFNGDPNWQTYLAAVFFLKDRCSGSFDQSVPLSSVTIHEKYDRIRLTNDLAVAALYQLVYYTPICLPPSTNSLISRDGVIVGFGTITNTNNSTHCSLHYANVTLISNAQCQQTTVAPYLRDSPADFCASSQRYAIDACQGDSGGSVMVMYELSFTLQGIASYSEGCSQPDKPTVYVNVGYYRTWIDRNTSSFGILGTIVGFIESLLGHKTSFENLKKPLN